jgi:orotidine-5'-phosphate decarboxylase
VARAVAAAVRSGASLVNVHAFGGREMLVAAAESARMAGPSTKIIAVTLLTSLDSRSLADLPISGHPEGIVRRLATLAKDCGLDGVVCAARDVREVKAAAGSAFLAVVPGIRPAGTDLGDQKRVATPAEALAEGADILVVGRPLTAAPDPDAALASLLSQIQSAS